MLTQFSMGKKCTKVEKKARVNKLADIIVKDYSQRELSRHVQELWGLSGDSASKSSVKQGTSLKLI